MLLKLLTGIFAVARWLVAVEEASTHQRQHKCNKAIHQADNNANILHERLDASIEGRRQHIDDTQIKEVVKQQDKIEKQKAIREKLSSL